MKKAKNKFSLRIGNILIITSIVGFVILFFPFLSSYFVKVDPQKIDSNTNSIYIPKINAYSKIQKDVDPFNKNEYLEALKSSVAHAKGTASIDQKGTTFYFAHSSANPYEMLRANTPFLRLFELKIDDEFYIYDSGKEYKLKVKDKKIVSPSEVNYLISKDDQVILQTCYPVGTDFKRLLIIASK